MRLRPWSRPQSADGQWGPTKTVTPLIELIIRCATSDNGESDGHKKKALLTSGCRRSAVPSSGELACSRALLLFRCEFPVSLMPLIASP